MKAKYEFVMSQKRYN